MIYPSTFGECLGSFQFGPIIPHIALDIPVDVFQHTYECISFGYLPRSEITGIM